MNLVRNGSLHPHLRDEEALVVENAIRLAIDSIVNVLYGVNSGRTREFKRMVADRDKEIQRLESRLKDIEHDLRVPRRPGCTCGLPEKAAASRSLAEPQTVEDGGFEPGIDAEMAAVQQECEMSFSLGLFARPPSHVSSQSHESAPPSSPSRVGLEQSCTSHSSESSALSEAARNLPASPSSLVVKEEPCDAEAFFIKWEMSEEGFREDKESASNMCPNKENPRKPEDRERRQFGENPHADPDGYHIAEVEHQRYDVGNGTLLFCPTNDPQSNKKKSVPMSQLPEEAQRLKRAAWRAASRRYYARKIARQQANPSRSVPFPHITDSRYSQPISVVDKTRRMLTAELPDESQMLQREAWRAASRRYYARKTSGLQDDPTQFVPLYQNTEPSEETLGPNGGGAHSSSGGIMCS